MYLLVGLGNPDKKYRNTRHNTGFIAVDFIADELGTEISKKKFDSLVSEVDINGERVMLMKPQTYMNLSGVAVQKAASFYKIPPEKIIVVFDDISLPPGRLRIRSDGSAGGHNGIKSIISELGSQTFPRVKVGVGGKAHPEQDLADHVLSGFSAKEEKDLKSALERAADAALTIMDKGIAEAANRYNGSMP